MPGPPTALTDIVKTRIILSIAAGASRGLAAQSAGVSRAGLMKWLKRGREEESAGILDEDGNKSTFRDLYEKVTLADASFELSLLARIITIGKDRGQWQALVWILVHKNPSRYSQNPSSDKHLERELAKLMAENARLNEQVAKLLQHSQPELV